MDESENGNGSLMRILPLIASVIDRPIDERFQVIKSASSITHAHVRSVMACFYYLEYALQLLETNDKFKAYFDLQKIIPGFLTAMAIEEKEIDLFNRLLKSDISSVPREQIKSTGYVLHTLEASMWCILSTSNYKDAVLKAVNLGEDTDTTAAVTGGLAGMIYGFDSIPQKWIEQLARKEDIEALALRLERKYNISR
jgi:ADP-ribosyl-[dinitrogen reductase] hydrolase